MRTNGSQAKEKSKSAILMLACAAGFLGFAKYGEDLQTKNLAAHSTFHYELTRTLARAAGFTAVEAESLAVINEAMDAETFTGETGVTIQLNGTRRVSDTGQYWHFARRDSSNATGEYLHPGGRNTCAYFTRQFTRSCPGEAPEMNEIEDWAIYASDSPSPGAPQISYDRGQTLHSVTGKSLPALAVYLHALADSYSHEACMASAQVRTHKPRPSECSAVHWHTQAEFGDHAEIDKGVNYTREAAQAVWLALKWFRQQTGRAEPALWTDEQASEFIQSWVKLDSAQDRRDAALQAFASL
ncbi:MAG: hypothetical protein ACREOO_16170 [bacterium]